ncbi:MAG: lytic transglycosylase domain-containing protein [bacterium]|nr:lytic transglycosylase domain-containing protein [bacterium]
MDKSIKLIGCIVAFSICGLTKATPFQASVDAAPPAVEPAVAAVEPIDRRLGFVLDSFSHFQSGLAPFEVEAVARTIIEEADRYKIDAKLVAAVIHTESGFSNFARSSVGALGLMQLMPATGEMQARKLGIEWYGSETLFDPHVNVKLGTSYLAFLYERYEDWDKALAAYNWGPGAVDRRVRRGAGVPEKYASKVMARLDFNKKATR